MLLADVEEFLEVIQNRVRVSLLSIHSDVVVLFVHLNPRLGLWRREAVVLRLVPHHWSASIVPAFQPDDIHGVRHVGFFGGVLFFPLFVCPGRRQSDQKLTISDTY